MADKQQDVHQGVIIDGAKEALILVWFILLFALTVCLSD